MLFLCLYLVFNYAIKANMPKKLDWIWFSYKRDFLFLIQLAELLQIEREVIISAQPFLLGGGGKADLVGT